MSSKGLGAGCHLDVFLLASICFSNEQITECILPHFYATFVADFQEEWLFGNHVTKLKLMRIHELNSYARVYLDMS